MPITHVAPSPVVRRPLERLEAEIVELATQVTAATARLLGLIAEFDAVEGWRDWGMRSTAHWLSWKCGLGITAGREQVRVARALRSLPVIAAEFARGRLSYSKVRALTRFATPETEVMLVEMSRCATAAQVEQLRHAARRARTVDEVRRRHAAQSMSVRWEEDGSLVATLRLAPERAAVFLHAVRTVQEGLPADASAEAPDERRTAADAVVVMAERALTDAAAAAGPRVADRYQLILLATQEMLGRRDAEDDDADEGPRLSDGTRLHPSTARRLTCGCPTTTMITDSDGNSLHLGRKTRRITGRLLKAVQLRHGGRCRAPGCTAAAEAIHHLQHWAHGGRTCLPNLVSVCAHHHWLVHEGGFGIAVRGPGEWVLLSSAGVTVGPSPDAAPTVSPLPRDANVEPNAVAGEWCGERLDLDAAITALTPTNASAEAFPVPPPTAGGVAPDARFQFSMEAVMRFADAVAATHEQLNHSPHVDADDI